MPGHRLSITLQISEKCNVAWTSKQLKTQPRIFWLKSMLLLLLNVELKNKLSHHLLNYPVTFKPTILLILFSISTCLTKA